jgi:phosphonate transport system substrate-binding protein
VVLPLALLVSRLRRLVAGLGLLLVIGCTPQVALASGGDDHVLVLGRISEDPKAHYEQLKPLLDYVVPRMAGVGIREGRVLMARDPQQMASYLRRGRVDWVTETAGMAVLLEQRANARPLLVTERNGVKAYRTVFIARRDSGIESLDDLRGRSVAFQSTSSTSAYFAPAIELLERRLPLEILLSPDDRPGAGSVGYLFARSELNIATWVHKRLVDAGVMSNLDWASAERIPPSYRRDLLVIHQTPEYPRALEMTRGDLEPRVAARLREVLIEASSDPDAREALLQFFQTTRFLPIDDGIATALERLRLGVAQVRTEVE